MKVLMVGQNTGNYGDEAAGLGCVGIFTDSNSIEEFGVMYRARKNLKFNELPINNEKLHHEGCFGYTNRILIIILCILHYFFPFLKNVSIFKEIRLYLKKIQKYDTILVGPMGVDIGKYKNWYLLLQLLLAKQNGLPICFHLVSIESSENRIFDRIANSILAKARIFVREHRSHEYLNRLGFSSEFGIDTAFAMKSNYDSEDNTPLKSDYIVLILTEKLISWHPDYKDKTIDSHLLILKKIVQPAVDFAKQKDFSIHIINHTTDKIEIDNLKRLVAEVKKDFKNITYNNVKTAYEYENEIKNSRFVITMRYHGVVMSVKNHIPFIALSYENKMKEVSSYSNCERNCIDLLDIIKGTGNVSDMIDMLDEEYTEIKQTLNKFDTSLLFKTVYLPLRSIERNVLTNF